ncbi:MAG: hypothetical protein ACI4TV_07080, partial [Paludibacteraceae bacterium]
KKNNNDIYFSHLKSCIIREKAVPLPPKFNFGGVFLTLTPPWAGFHLLIRRRLFALVFGSLGSGRFKQ